MDQSTTATAYCKKTGGGYTHERVEAGAGGTHFFGSPQNIGKTAVEIDLLVTCVLVMDTRCPDKLLLATAMT